MPNIYFYFDCATLQSNAIVNMLRIKISKFYCDHCKKIIYVQGDKEENFNTHRFVCHFEEQNNIIRDNTELKAANDTLRLDTICKLIELRKEVVKNELQLIKIDREEAKKIALNLGKTPKWTLKKPTSIKIPTYTKNASKVASNSASSTRKISKNGGKGAKNRNKGKPAQTVETETPPGVPYDPVPSTSKQNSAN